MPPETPPGPPRETPEDRSKWPEGLPLGVTSIMSRDEAWAFVDRIVAATCDELVRAVFSIEPDAGAKPTTPQDVIDLWNSRDGNTPGYAADKAANYGAQAAFWKRRALALGASDEEYTRHYEATNGDGYRQARERIRAERARIRQGAEAAERERLAATLDDAEACNQLDLFSTRDVAAWLRSGGREPGQ